MRVRSVRDISRHHMERVTGIEPAFSAWEIDSGSCLTCALSIKTSSSGVIQFHQCCPVMPISDSLWHGYGTKVAVRKENCPPLAIQSGT